MYRTLSAWSSAVAFAVAPMIALRAQSISPPNGARLATDIGTSHAASLPDSSGSHRVRMAGIIGGSIGLAAGVVGGSMLQFGDIGRDDRNAPARAIAYVGASGAVVGWIVGTTVVLPFHGRNVIGPHDVRNATITGGVVGLMTGVAAGSLMGFKCAYGCSASASPLFTIALSGVLGGLAGAAIGNSVGMALPR